MSKFKLLSIDSSTGQLKHTESPNLNVKDFGAFADGTNAAATTSAINNAIAAAIAAGGQSVYFPTGTYLVNASIDVPGGVTIYGDGAEKTIIQSNTNQVILNLIEGSGNYAFLGPRVKNLGVKGSKTTGTSQIGIKVDDNLYVAFVEVSSVRVETCGSHGLYFGKVFSSRFIDIYSNDNAGYPFLFDGAQMPSNHFESLYAGDLNTGFLAGFRVRKGNVTLVSCNGINNSPSESWWAIIGDITGLEADGASTNSTTSLSLINCNLESSKAGGVKSYANSVVDFIGENKFVGDSTGSGLYQPILYEVNTTLYPYPAFLPKGTLDNRTVFSNSYYEQIRGRVSINGTATVTGLSSPDPNETFFTEDLVVGQLVLVNGETRRIQTINNNQQFITETAFSTTASNQVANKVYYKEGATVHSDELPPLQVSGQGPKISGGEFQYRYWNYSNLRSEALPRYDSSLTKESVTTTSSFTNPGVRLYEINAASDITLGIEWAGWYNSPQPVYVINKSANGVVITLDPANGTIGGFSTYQISHKNENLVLIPNGENWDVVSRANTDRINVKDYGAKGDGVTNDTTAINNAKTAAITLGVPLYFPSGNYLTDGITIADTQSVKIYGDSPLKSKITSRVGTAPALLFTSNSSHVHTILIENLGIVGFGTNSANHGISVTGSLEPSNFTIRNVTISNVAGNGINVTAGLFTQLYEGVDISVVAAGGNGFDILGSNDCTFSRCYVHTVGTSKAAYRIHSGVPTFIGCNGIDSGTTANWGTFGDVTAEDGADRYVRAVLIGTNIEDFTDTGIRFKTGSTGTFIGTTITAPASGTVKALVFDFVDSNTGGFFDSASGILTKGASWTNSEPVHSSGMPFVQIGHRELTTYRDTGVGASTSIPGITGTLISGQSDYALTFDGISRFKNYIKIDEVSAPPTPAANSVNLYAKDKAGVSALYFKNDAGTETEIGGGTTSFANPTASIGLSAVNGSASTAMRSDAAPALSQSITPTWTGLHTFNLSTTPSTVLLLDIGALGTDGTRNSHNIVFRGRSRSAVQHTPEWRVLTEVTSNVGASRISFQHQYDSGGWTPIMYCDDTGLLTATAFQGDGSLITSIDISNVSGNLTANALTMNTNKLVGRSSASTGALEEITVGSGLSLSGGTLSTVSSGGISWSETTGTTQSMAVNTGYIANNASRVVFTLPNTASVGDVVRVSGKGAGGWRIGQNTGEIIHFGDLDTTTGTGGYVESSQVRDAIELVCVVQNTEWNVISSVGNITIV